MLQANANQPLSNISKASYVDWFLNIGANQYVDLDIVSKTSLEPYLGINQLYVGNGKGLIIFHTSDTKLYTSKRTFIFSNFL